MVKRRRRRRDARTQKPNSITVRRVGTGRATELTTFSWVSPPSAWDATAAAMAGQVRKSQRSAAKSAKKRAIAKKVSRREARAERVRAKYRKPSASPFDALPGMAGRTETGRAKQLTIPAGERRRNGLGARGSPSTLTPELARTVLELRAAGLSYQRVAQETGHPASSLRHWVVSGRAAAMSEDRGQTR